MLSAIGELVAEVKMERLKEYVRKLEGLRHGTENHPMLEEKAEFIKEELESFGLRVENQPFLYKGRIWVDAAEFAVAKMEVQPAKNPSFWISRTLIHHTNGIANGFWLPEQNRSETKVRIGGTAIMSIDYQSYRITTQSGSSATPPAAGTR